MSETVREGFHEISVFGRFCAFRRRPSVCLRQKEHRNAEHYQAVHPAVPARLLCSVSALSFRGHRSGADLQLARRRAVDPQGGKVVHGRRDRLYDQPWFLHRGILQRRRFFKDPRAADPRTGGFFRRDGRRCLFKAQAPSPQGSVLPDVPLSADQRRHELLCGLPLRLQPLGRYDHNRSRRSAVFHFRCLAVLCPLP